MQTQPHNRLKHISWAMVGWLASGFARKESTRMVIGEAAYMHSWERTTSRRAPVTRQSDLWTVLKDMNLYSSPSISLSGYLSLSLDLTLSRCGTTALAIGQDFRLPQPASQTAAPLLLASKRRVLLNAPTDRPWRGAPEGPTLSCC